MHNDDDDDAGRRRRRRRLDSTKLNWTGLADYARRVRQPNGRSFGAFQCKCVSLALAAVGCTAGSFEKGYFHPLVCGCTFAVFVVVVGVGVVVGFCLVCVCAW